jgi:hypothetical protein
MHRRDFLTGSLVCTLSPVGYAQSAASVGLTSDQRVAALLSWLLRQGKTTTSARQLAEEIGKNVAPAERRIIAFEVVRALPYKLARFDPQKQDSLFALGFGDCRHKAAGFHRLLQALGESSRTVLMPFDWRDLPIPASILANLEETRGFHDCVQIEIDGQMRLADPTWDGALLKAGFPGSPRWNGKDATPAITAKAGPVVLHTEFRSYTELFERFEIRWPKRDRTLAFNRAFNGWASELRASLQVSAGR